jgi:hypothetical protein
MTKFANPVPPGCENRYFISVLGLVRLHGETLACSDVFFFVCVPIHPGLIP